MATKKFSSHTVPQPYPRISDEQSKEYGYLDESKLVPHKRKMSNEELTSLISTAIRDASKKSSRAILSIKADAGEEEAGKIYKWQGKELFKYFRKYCGDPAATAHQIFGKNYRDVGRELFRNRTLQKERMNSGWRYQFLARSCAAHSKRFAYISDIGAAEADFNAVIELLEKGTSLNLYVSVKNRSDTLGGQDWPKAIQALETVAKVDKNRNGPYCCVFGIAMERGRRRIPREQKSTNAHSVNTEIWLSDFFWPFFANYSYEEIMSSVLNVLFSSQRADELTTQVEIPDQLLDAFGEACFDAELTDVAGDFDNAYKLVQFFCQPATQRGGNV